MNILAKIVEDIVAVDEPGEIAEYIGYDDPEGIEDKLLGVLYDSGATEPSALKIWVSETLGRHFVWKVLKKLEIDVDRQLSQSDLIDIWFKYREFEARKLQVRPLELAGTIAQLSEQILGTPRKFDAYDLLAPMVECLMRYIGFYYAHDLPLHEHSHSAEDSEPRPADTDEISETLTSLDFAGLCDLLAYDQPVKFQPYDSTCKTYVSLADESRKPVLRQLATITDSSIPEEWEKKNVAFTDSIVDLLDYWQVAQEQVVIPKGAVVTGTHLSDYDSQVTCVDEFNASQILRGVRNQIGVGANLLLAKVDHAEQLAFNLESLPQDQVWVTPESGRTFEPSEVVPIERGQETGVPELDRTRFDSDRSKRLVEIMMSRFSTRDLKELAFWLDIKFDDIPGSARNEKIIELVEFLESRNRLQDLIDIGKERRTDIDWDEF